MSALELRPGRHELDLAVERRSFIAVVEVLRDLSNAEAPQGDAHQTNAVGQEGEIHREALHAAVDIGADLPKQHADQAHGHAIGLWPAVAALPDRPVQSRWARPVDRRNSVQR